MIVPYNALLHLALIPVFCIGAIAEPNRNKVCKKRKKIKKKIKIKTFTHDVIKLAKF